MAFKSLQSAQSFLYDFFGQSGIHGFSYLGNSFFHFIERVLWSILICAALYWSVILSLESWDRYLHHSTVVSIERDHYYWNTSLPALTICPMERLSREKYDLYASRHKIKDEEKEEFFLFLESLANATFINFQNIASTPRTDAILERLNIQPKDYLRKIYELTEDWTKIDGTLEQKVRNVNNLEFIRVIQVVTEYGICYSTNNFLSYNLSTAMLLENRMPTDDIYYKKTKLHYVRYGNLFDGEVTFSFIGFKSAMSIFMHSAYETMNIARPVGNGYTYDAYEFETLSIEIITTDDFRDDTFISQRNCRFHFESNLTHYKVYTKNLCMSQCRLDLAYRRCKCIPHFYHSSENTKPICSYKQLKTCFPQYRELFLEFAVKDADGKTNETENCYCLQNCLDSNVIVEKFQVLKGTKALLGSTGGLVIMKKYPLIRFQREVIFTLTDFFVSIGGTAGFFVGISVLSVIEIVYFFSLRLLWFILGYHKAA